MRFRPLEYVDPSDDPVFKNDWWFIPEDQDKSIVLLEAKRCVDALKKAGIPVVQTIIAHEAPKLLCAPPVIRLNQDRNFGKTWKFL